MNHELVKKKKSVRSGAGEGVVREKDELTHLPLSVLFNILLFYFSVMAENK